MSANLKADIEAAVRESQRTVDDRYSYEFGKGSSTPATDVDIHKIIDDAMEKRDRSVTIFINKDATTVSVYPYEDKPREWIPQQDHLGRPDGFKCPECGMWEGNTSPYCPSCGEKLKRPT